MKKSEEEMKGVKRSEVERSDVALAMTYLEFRIA